MGFTLTGKCENFTAELSWDRLARYNNSEIVVIIEWRTTYDPPSRWYTVPRTVSAIEGQTKVSKLSPWSKIQFRAMARNSYGNSPACRPTQFESCETSPTRKYLGYTKMVTIGSTNVLWLYYFRIATGLMSLFCRIWCRPKK